MEDNGPSVCVFAASPLLTITVEAGSDDVPEIHLHAGGQGFWIARMVAALGVPVRLCGAFGGETGDVLSGMIEREGVGVRATPGGPNGAYVHDRRGGERRLVAEMPPQPLSRHDVDELYGAALVEGMRSRVAVLAGPRTPQELPSDTYARLAADLSAAGTSVVADLSGDVLTQALDGGLAVVKASHEDLIDDGLAASDSFDDLVAAVHDLASRGADAVVVSRADEPALALVDGRLLEVVTPSLQTVDHRGAGDSMTAGISAAIARGATVNEAVRLGAAAGALNVTRRGLATGHREVVQELASRVELRELRSSATRSREE